MILGRAAAALAAALWATAAHAASPAATVAERLVAQQGLALAAASTLLQSQLLLLDAIRASPGPFCQLLGANGSFENPSANQFVFYYDTVCSRKFIETVETTVAPSANPLGVSGTATYYGPTGSELGTLKLSASILSIPNAEAPTRSEISAHGTFTPVKKSSIPVDLGVACTIPSSAPLPFPCTAGVAQDFPALGESLGSLTPLTLLPARAGSAITLSGTKSQLVTASGRLAIAAPSLTTLAFKGKHTAFGSAATGGTAGAFVLFPPTPTDWTVTDSAHGIAFSITVLQSLKATGTVATTGANRQILANFNLDESGTGSIDWSSGESDAITAWTLSD
jgi:hypothetical protein